MIATLIKCCICCINEINVRSTFTRPLRAQCKKHFYSFIMLATEKCGGREMVKLDKAMVCIVTFFFHNSCVQSQINHVFLTALHEKFCTHLLAYWNSVFNLFSLVWATWPNLRYELFFLTKKMESKLSIGLTMTVLVTWTCLISNQGLRTEQSTGQVEDDLQTWGLGYTQIM